MYSHIKLYLSISIHFQKIPPIYSHVKLFQKLSAIYGYVQAKAICMGLDIVLAAFLLRVEGHVSLIIFFSIGLDLKIPMGLFLHHISENPI